MWMVLYRCPVTSKLGPTQVTMLREEQLRTVHLAERTAFSCHSCGNKHRIESRESVELRREQ
jgi:RNase P subunit RPR2